ncbi:MAG: tetratricopeptide repeat protein [Verrucomicrobia bacterium]|nr:tetratricopeptide repeat protein [Verrucomicrobiota bacterium]
MDIRQTVKDKPGKKNEWDEDFQDQPGYLYHKQTPQRRNRFSRKALPPRAVRQDRAPDPARKVLLSNIRTAVIVAICMFAVLFAAVYIAKRSWDVRQQEASKRRPTVLTEARGVTVVPMDGEHDEKPGAINRAMRKQLDTEAIRKAVFLAKRAQNLAETGAYDDAIAKYREALEVWPYLTEGWAEIGKLYLYKREFLKAQIALQRAVESDPGAPQTLNDLAVSHLYQAHIDKAMELLQAVIDIDPQYAPPLFNMALCHLARDQRVEARDFLRQFLRLKPGDARALKELAFLDASDGDYRQALTHLKEGIEDSPEWSPLYFDAAAAAALMGDSEEAISLLEKAETLTSPRIAYQMYQQPAFRQIRMIELGKLFEKRLAERAREKAEEELDRKHSEMAVTEPISSANASASPSETRPADDIE